MQQTEPSSLPAAPLAPTGELLAPGEINFYRVLDVDRGASRLQIREAYLRLKNAYGGGSAALYSLISEDEAAEQLAQVETAFRVLSDEVSRRAYDLELGTKRQAAPITRQGAVNQLDSGLADRVADSFHLGIYGDDLRGRPSPSASEAAARADAMIRTHRSTLPVIKLKANKAATPEVQAKLAELLSAGDPADGTLLRGLREACDVSEEEICERTKVTIGYIQAIESNRFERLPQAVFVKGFLRSYCRYLCIPEAETLVTAFSARLMDWQANRKG